jgi:magnesium transporter
MSDIDVKNTRSRVDTVQQCLEDIKVILENHQNIEVDSRGRRTLTQVVGVDSNQEQSLIDLQERLDSMHPADIAAMLEQLPLDERLIVWSFIPSGVDGDVLLEVSDAVRETLIADMNTQELVAATEQLDADEIADLAPN